MLLPSYFYFFKQQQQQNNRKINDLEKNIKQAILSYKLVLFLLFNSLVHFGKNKYENKKVYIYIGIYFLRLILTQ